ncbi:apoptotic protease-activating factor 1 [Bicyclus anynana]|uniref:Apoptotic protease-activating factor 1 n=1 Tax=Bicyclus anynana TaxID=110368 RepID=A0ABM3LP99_BICAN|nr:apoptotic protease-activating factor 1 [Bicyclus anynana]
MDSRNRMLLQHHQQDIVRDLDVKYILDELFTNNAISNEVFDHIYNLTDRVDRTRYLLDTLLQSGNNCAFNAFVDSLAKDYKWLWEKLAVENNKDMIEDSFEDNLSRGDVPRLPDHFVRRLSLERDVLVKLKSMNRHQILVLHGMSGCGKTALTISVLRSNPLLITSDFTGVMFWLNCSDCKTEDDIIAQQNKLYRKASSLSLHISHMKPTISMSSICSNGDSLSSYDLSSQELRDRLKTLFSEPQLKDALLVLDELNEKKCLEAFDIGCRILVTTRDTDVVSNFNPQIVKVENHFSEEESLALFASCLDVDVSHLPRQAKRLHEICKGSPFHIALIGAELAENKEKLIHGTRHWNYYLSKLEKKDLFFLTRHNDNPMKTIEVCINSLKPDILPLFKMLCVLPDNVKVSARVLSKLWDKDVPNVEIIMKQLRTKSLITQIYDQEKQSYLYEIHDIIMNYLRSCPNEGEMKKLHSDFLKSYNYNDVNDVPVQFVDDDYIAFYIGYHLVRTKNLNNKWSLFNRLYLDLKFLGNKVRLTGPADVIYDLQKYENHIANDELDKTLIFSIREFLSRCGIDLHRYPCTDLVQSILQNESKGILYTKAWQDAKERSTKNELYFEFLHEQNVEEVKHSTIDVKETITAVCFLGDYVLIGTLTGVIMFFHIATNKLRKQIQSTDSAITWLGVCPANPPFVASLSADGFIKLWYIDDVEQDVVDDVIEEGTCNSSSRDVCAINYLGVCPANPPFVASLSADGFIKLWYIDDVEQDVVDDVIEEGTCNSSSRDVCAINYLGVCPANPPFVASLSADGFIKLWYIDDVEQDVVDDVIEEETEESYNNNYPSSVTIRPNLGPFISCRWANNEETLITNTFKMIILYDTSGKVLHLLDNLYRDKEILRCIPCNNDNRVIVSTTNGHHTLELVDLKTKERQVFKENETILDLATIPDSNRILGLKQREVTEYEFQMSRRFHQHSNSCQSKTVVTSDMVKENVSFISMAVNKSGTLLFVSTDDSRVICVDLKTNSYVFELENKRGNVVSMAVSVVWDDFEPGADVLLTGTGCVENTAKVWYLDAAYISHNTQKNGKVRLTTKFDASFINILSPHTPNAPPPPNAHSTNSTPKRHQSFVSSSTNEVVKRTVATTMSLDRHALKPLNLKGICNGNNEGVTQPLLAVVDDKNNIQIMRGGKLVSEISTHSDEQITAVKISPCNQYVIFGLHSGIVRRYTIRTKATKDIMDVYSAVQYMSFVSPNLLIVAGRSRCLMAYRATHSGDWKPEMLQRGNTNLGSQEILNDIKGISSKSNHSDRISSSGSDSSITSRDRHFSNGEKKVICNASSLVNCYWIQDVGLITIESNASIKLWDENLKLSSVLNYSQVDVCISCSDFKKNILVICDMANLSFQTFELNTHDMVELRTIQEYKLNNRIYSCALTADGNILAMGLNSGDVVVWNVPNKRQLKLLKHHKTKVQYCSFSPTPDRLYRSSMHSPSAATLSPPSFDDESQPPLVLVTMATEVVWWNVTYVIRTRNVKGMWNKPGGWNVVTPVTSPIDPRNDTPTNKSSSDSNKTANFFFGDNGLDPKQMWKANWKKKTYKEGSKRKEILSCIKLSGMSAKQICHDENFSHFVTVDNAGHVHIMNLLNNCNT